MKQTMVHHAPCFLNRITITTIGIILILVPLFSCSFEEPVAPKWDVDLPIPLMNRTITMQELVDKNDFLILNPDGLISIDYEDELEKYEVGDHLKVQGIQETFSGKLGNVEIESPGTQSASLTLSDIFPPATTLDGQTVPVPSFSFNQIPAEIQGFENFESVLLESGYIRITLTNDLPIPISENLLLQVKRQHTDEIVLQFQFPQMIQPGSSAEEQVDLAGIRVPSDLKFEISGGSPGSGSDPVYINSQAAGITIEAYISPIVAAEARAIIEEQDFSGTDSLFLGDSIIVSQATIASGFFMLDYENNIPLDLHINLELNDFYDLQGQVVSLAIPINSGERKQQLINVSGYEFRPPFNQQGNRARFSWNAYVYGSNGRFITISGDDDVRLDVQLSEIVFSELRGYLKEIRVSLEPFEESIDLPDGLDSLKFESARLELMVNNGIGFKVSPDINIQGTNESSGKTVALPVQHQIEPANGHPVLSSIVLDENNSQLIEFLNISPNQIKVTGSVLVGDGTIESEISNSDFIETSVHITVPLALSFPSQSIKTDLDTIEIDDDAQDELRENILAGSLYAELGNHLPFGFDISLHFSGNDTSVYTNPELVIGPINMQPASISPTSGRVENEYKSEIAIDLTQEEIALFADDEIYFSLKAHIPGSNGQMVRVFSDDYMNVKAYCEMRYHVDPEKLSEK